MFRIFFMVVSLFMNTAVYASTLIIGDSIFALTKQVPKNLEAAGIDFVLRARTGASMNEILQQYIDYKEQFGTPDMVIFNGGGNDVLRGGLRDCMVRNSRCQYLVDRAINTAVELILLMDSDGVDRAIYVGLHLVTGPFKPLNEVIESAMDQVPTILDGAPMRVKFVDLRPGFRNRDDLHLFDKIHPNALGSKIISDAILEAL